MGNSPARVDSSRATTETKLIEEDTENRGDEWKNQIAYSRIDAPIGSHFSEMVGREILRCDDVPLVQDFIARNGILPLVQKAVELIGELFPQLREIKLEVSLDPEESAEWLLLRVASTASLADLTSAYRRYIRKWVSETPAEKRHFVRLSYTSV